MSQLCKYCMVCVKPCSDDCKEYEPNSYLNEHVDIEYEVKYGVKKEEPR